MRKLMLTEPQAYVSAPKKALFTYEYVQLTTAIFDFCALAFSGILGFSGYHYFIQSEISRPDGGIGIGVTEAVLCVVIFRSRGLFSVQAVMEPARFLKQILLVVAFTLLSLIAITFLLKVEYEISRGAFICFAFFALTIVPIERFSIAHFAKLGIGAGIVSGKRAVLVGEASELERAAPHELRDFGIKEVARVGIAKSESGNGLSERGRAHLGRAIILARELGAVEFALMFSWSHDRLISEVGELLRASPLPVKLLPDHAIRRVAGPRRRGGLSPEFTIETQRAPLGLSERLSKRLLDLVLSVGALLALSPLLLVTAIAIKMDSKGPVLFRQRRVGFDNKEFVIYKFRSMTVAEDGDEIVQARRDDIRVTRLGKILRRSSIDELPQLLNVIRGEMSLVGPRPHATAHHNQYSVLISGYALRHHVKPGLTGMAQIRGFRGETRELVEMRQRLEQDLWYINHWSLALDFIIIFRTAWALLRHDAY